MGHNEEISCKIGTLVKIRRDVPPKTRQLAYMANPISNKDTKASILIIEEPWIICYITELVLIISVLHQMCTLYRTSHSLIGICGFFVTIKG